ncbi:MULTISPECIES: hypothetical protein [Aerococcus]|uniref:Uncharacterized protein n=1 Tax=Aerococcus sanguinicola TaxID=119206 RepID=A0A5N1GM93_9LACT|nr:MULTISPECIES: hypothetical protein [Aerococcus]KAA9302087.1 hypothetical protein F6I03_02435 [Aerococcus sanguinicola]MDK6368485.1 hypothetical protein [Aerococcus sp. UMB9870]MDK6679568.1 hypothetical protein [Aerococcus sp. UMB8608]MDK6686412.1 hypothetical protein [Aerococcus sp. UMB8623]MDK6940966.1 hypothetical protein [Aerococcus sp. UMB8487]
MEHSIYLQLINCVKILTKNVINFPDYGSQSKFNLYNQLSKEEKYSLIVNRKGHLREDYLTYIMNSEEHKIMVRLDYAGPPHDNRNPDGSITTIDTPHVHIFSEKYDNGRIAIPLSDISDKQIINELRDSLIAFLLYNNVDLSNIEIALI